MPEKDQLRAIGEIRQLITRINQAWLKGQPQELKAYFHPDIQFVGTKLEILGSGRQVCIDSYRDFLNQAVILKFHESDPEVQIWGYSALARYRFKIEYEMNSKTHVDSGSDLFLFTCEEDRWLVVWRLLLSE